MTDRDSITFTVFGMAPAPQGSKRHVGGGVMVESCKQLKPWRYLVTQAALATAQPIITGPVHLSVVFLFQRPKGHHNAKGVKPSAPQHHAVKPDLSKLIRSTEDALTGTLLSDDSRIATLTASKRYCTAAEHPGAIITIVPL